MNPRLAALRALLQVRQQGQSLSQVLPAMLAKIEEGRDRGFAQNLLFGTLRHYWSLCETRDRLIAKPLKQKDEDVNSLILIALYQIIHLDTPPHAAVSETVKLSQKLKKPWARGLINAVLRNFLRQQDTGSDTKQSEQAEYNHPQWFIDQVKQHYPQDWQNLLQQNNQSAPIYLRVNARRYKRDDYLQKLKEHGIEAQAHPLSASAITLNKAQDITQLPEFDQGAISVQDIAAQQAAWILVPKAGERILDACAAPGGKTCHLLELSDNQAQVVAIEKDEQRIERLQQNLARLKLNAQCQQGDAAEPASWWDGELFDKILLDAPCSASGIIRRHPDIKHHRRAQDSEALLPLQAKMLSALWPLLKPQGYLLYATCSVLTQENAQQIEHFLNQHPEAKLCALDRQNQAPSHAQTGWQLLPGQQGMDGFYYALLQKTA